MRLFLCRKTLSRALGLVVCAVVVAVLWLARNDRTNVASAKQGAVAIADSEFGRYTADQVIDGQWVRPNERPEKNRWHSSQGKAEPHWIWIRFKQPARIERAVIQPADTRDYPTAMVGEFSRDGGVTFSTLFTITNNQPSAKSFAIEKSFSPVVTDNFRIRILQSSGHVNEAQLSEVQVFGKFTEEPKVADSDVANESSPSLAPTTTDGLEITERPGEIEFRSQWLRLAVSKTVPRITALCWDGLGEGKVNENFLKSSTDGGVRLFQKPLFPEPWLPAANPPLREGNVVRYSQTLSFSDNVLALWEIRVEPKSFSISVTTTASKAKALREPLALRFAFDPAKTPVAPLANPCALSTAPLPCLLHAADYGTLLVRSSSDVPVSLRTEPTMRALTRWNALLQPRLSARATDGLFVQSAGANHFQLEFSVQTALPQLINDEPRLRSLARSWLNSFQYRPDIGILANNILSDNAPLCLFTFTDPAVFTPTLPGGIEAIHLARESLDRYFAGAPGYGIGREDIQADVCPSLLISAWDVIRVTGDLERLHQWLPTLEKIAGQIEAQDRNCNGLPESTRSGVDRRSAPPISQLVGRDQFRSRRCLRLCARLPRISRACRSRATRWPLRTSRPIRQAR